MFSKWIGQVTWHRGPNYLKLQKLSVLQTTMTAKSSWVYASSPTFSWGKWTGLLKQKYLISKRLMQGKHHFYTWPWRMGHLLLALHPRRPKAAIVFCLHQESLSRRLNFRLVWSGLTLQNKWSVHNHVFSFTTCNQNVLAQNTAFITPARHVPPFFDCGRLW